MRLRIIEAVMLALILLVSAAAALAANDPGHDTLYVLRIGDTNVTGSINLTGNVTAQLVRVSSRFFGDNLDIRADGSATTAQNFIKGTATDLEIGSASKIILNGGGTIVQVGTVAAPADINVTGSIYEGNMRVCLSNGTNCPGGTNTGNVSSVNAGNGIAVDQATGDVTVSINAATCGAGNYSYWDGNSWECRADQNAGGTGNITGAGTNTRIAKFTAAGTIANSIMTESGTTVTVNGNLATGNLTTTGNINTPSNFYIGNSASAANTSAVAIGEFAVAASEYALALGWGSWAKASGANAAAIGSSTLADGEYALAIGGGSSATGHGAVALGYAIVNGTHSIGIGDTAIANATNTTAIGPNATATQTSAIALGSRAQALHDSSIALGRDTTTTANNQLMIGASSYNLNTYIYGNLNVSSGKDICITGGNCLSSVSGGNTSWNESYANTLYAKGAASSTDNAIARYDSTTGKILQNSAVTIDDSGNIAGAGNISVPTNFWIGNGASAAGVNAIAIGASAEASNDSAVAVGNLAKANGSTAFALGPGTIASGGASTAIGYLAEATSDYATAIGYDSSATGANGGAYGHAAIASGSTSTAIGEGAQATNTASIAIGTAASASHAISIALGPYATTTAGNQFVVGNLSYPLNTRVFGILNAYELQVNGTAVCRSDGTNCPAGTTYTNGTGITLTGSQFNLSTSYTDTLYVARNTWTSIDSYPAACAAGQAVLAIGDVLTCVPIVNGTGSSGNLSHWTGTGTLSSSQIYQNGSNIGIGTTNPTTTLHVNKTFTANRGQLTIEGASGGASAITFYDGSNYGTYLSWDPTANVTRLQTHNAGNYGALVLQGVSGNVGIGTTAPTQKLDVNGSINVSGTSAKLYTPELCLNGNCQTSWPSGSVNITGSGTTNYTARWTNSTNLGIGALYDNGTNVGIGTTNPQYALEVNGTIAPTIDQNYNLGEAGRAFSSVTTMSVTSSGTLDLLDATDTSHIALAENSATYYAAAHAFSGNTSFNTNTLFVDVTNSRVGIGTASPAAKLHINGSGGTSAIINDTSSYSALAVGGATQAIIATSDTGTTTNRQTFHLLNNDGTFKLRLMNDAGSAAVQDNIIVANYDGTVGIGTATTYQRLTVNGSANISGTLYASNVSSNSPLRLQTAGTTRMYINDSTGDVGINTSAPRGALDVDTPGNVYLTNNTLQSGTSSLYLPGHIFITPYSTGNITYIQARRSDNSGTTEMQLRTYNGGVLTEAMRITGAGNVGIGTTAPSSKLHVYGDSQTDFGVYDTPLIIKGDSYSYLYINGTGSQAGTIYLRDANTGFLTAFNNNGDFRISPTAGSGQSAITNAKDGLTGITIKNNTGLVGIGTTSPTTLLHVNGSSSQYVLIERGGKQMYVNANYGGTDTYGAIHMASTSNMGISISSNDSKPEYFYMTTAGNVGIGTTSPATKLHANKTGSGDTEVGRFSAPGGNPYITLGEGLTSTSGGYMLWDDTNNKLRLGAHGATAITIDSSQNVGIGTSSPSYLLDIQGKAAMNNYTLLAADSDSILPNGDFEQGMTGWTANGGTISTTEYSGNRSLQITGSNSFSNDDFIPVDPDYDVFQLEAYVREITTGSPTPGVLYFGYYAYDENKTIITTAPCGTYCYFAAANYNIPNDGNWYKVSSTTTGEGTSMPNFPVGTKYVKVMGLVNYGASGNEVTLIDHITLKRLNHGPAFIGNNYASANLVNNQQVTKLYTTSTNQFTVEAPGPMKIGTGTPGNATGTNDLYVQSDIEYDGNLYGPGADLAELIHANEPLEAGDVVVADAARAESIKRSTQPYNTAVVGIVSSNPGIILSKSKGDVPLALSGRVPVKVSAENGPIKPGDLLTTSSTPGHAMRCESTDVCQGAIVAKSLGFLESGTGMITALVMLG